jgi:hypothetical protein
LWSRHHRNLSDSTPLGLLAGSTFKISDLPRDMREELFNLHATGVNPNATQREFNARAVPEQEIDVSQLDVSGYPEGSTVGYENPKDMPPVVIANGKLIDGGHRVAAAQRRGITVLRAIDMTGVIDPESTGSITDLPKARAAPRKRVSLDEKIAVAEAELKAATDAYQEIAHTWVAQDERGDVLRRAENAAQKRLDKLLAKRGGLRGADDEASDDDADFGEDSWFERLNKKSNARKASMRTALATNNAVFITHGTRKILLVKTPEMSNPHEGPVRVTVFDEDGPVSHTTRATLDKIADELTDDWHPQAIEPATTAEVDTFMSTERFAKGSAAVIAVQKANAGLKGDDRREEIAAVRRECDEATDALWAKFQRSEIDHKTYRAKVEAIEKSCRERLTKLRK